ncbi:helix-turn-helix domain-containing protein [Paenibacillus sp. M1]|uniref:Helix-turn-helix domain-containing protein n=1 Tax=Paenibacillus haidiansis TaxID=1574488 RepID=A0ABU7VM24_9BACL
MKPEHELFEFQFDSLEMLAEKMNDLLGRPVTIEDASHRLIAYSSHAPETDPARLATIVGRRVPDNVLGSLWQGGVIARLQESDEPVRVAAISDVGLSERVAIAIRSNAGTLGYIWVVENEKPFTPQELGLLKQAARAAKAKMALLQLNRHKEEEARKDFFWQLLTGYAPSETAIAEMANKIGVLLPPVYHVVLLQFAAEIKERLMTQALQAVEKSSAVSHCRLLLHAAGRNQLILLLTPAHHHGKEHVLRYLQFIKQEIENLFADQFIGLASSRLSSQYIMVEEGYREAQLLLRIQRRFKRETEHIVYYPDLGYYRYLHLIRQENRKHGSVNESIEKLKAYDAEHHGELLHTLDVFLSRDSNAKAAADGLHIHTNTLNYRLKRITEISGIDLTNMEQKVSLYLDLKAEQFGSDKSSD